MLKIVADENIPFACELFSELGEVRLLPGRTMSHADMQGVDVLLVRSVTKVDKTLLAGSNIRFVGTCTIGTDHLDMAYMDAHNIAYSSAPGCNAQGVVQYALCALAKLGRLEQPAKAAIIGCGNVGSRVWAALKALGMQCKVIDPHLNKSEISDLAEFEAIYDCDIICMHAPRVVDGPYPTEKMLGLQELNKLKPGALLLNAGRGECIDNDALLTYLTNNDDLQVVLDVWANEPHMKPELFKLVKFGSPHIAGYSFEGKVNGTTMIFAKLAEYLGKDASWVAQRINALRAEHLGICVSLHAQTISDLVMQTYDIEADHQRLADAQSDLPASFDLLRKTYPQRREFGHFSVRDLPEELKALAMKLGFCGE